MSGLIILFVAILAVLVLGILAQAYGVDSRPDFDDQHAPVRGLTS
jgi:hypothetical protein